MSDMERMAKKVCELIPGNLHDIPAIEMRPHQFKCERCGHIVKALTKAHERGRKEGLEKAIDIANYVPLEEQFIPAGNYSSKGMSGLVKVIRKGIVEAIRTAKEGK